MSFFVRVKRKLIRTFFREQWSILVCDPAGNILTHIVPPTDRFWADPFPVEHEGKIYIFAEQQIGSGNGTLGYIELYPDLSYSPFIPILEKPYHLSFPNVFSVDSDGGKIWYMIPESHENNTVDLYRADTFPGKWVHEVALLKNIWAVDSVVFLHNDYWWLFTSVGDASNPVNKNFSVFYSKIFPSDEWTAHPKNPIASGLDNSRMAGAVFTSAESGGPMRPAQNCLKDYGREVNINEITELTTETYSEKIVRTLHPEKNLNAVCTHTVNYGGPYMLRDIKTRQFKNKL